MTARRAAWVLGVASSGAWIVATAGLPISLLYEPEYTERAAAVAAAFASDDAIEASRMLEAEGVDYLYVGDAERRAHDAAALAKFDHAPERFDRVFQNAAVTIDALH